MPHEPCIKSEYLDDVFYLAKLNAFLEKAVPLVEKYDFQAFAFRGISGALVAPILAHKTQKTLIVVRKPREKEHSHSMSPVEGDRAANRYIIVDDFQSTGQTVNSIIRGISIFNPIAQCLGTLFYRESFVYGSTPRISACQDILDDLQKFVCADPNQFLLKQLGENQ